MRYYGALRALSASLNREGKSVIYATPGAMTGMVGLGELQAYAGEKAPAPNVFVGSSAGAGNGAKYFYGEIGRAHELYERAAAFEFVRMSPFPPFVRLDMEAFLHALLADIDVEAVPQRPDGLWTVATRAGTSENVLLNFRDDPFRSLWASMAVRSLCQSIEVRGECFDDGGHGCDPLSAIVEKFHPRNIVILGNKPLESMDRTVIQELKMLEKRKGVRWCGVFPDDTDPTIETWTHDIALLHDAKDRARDFTTKLIRSAQ